MHMSKSAPRLIEAMVTASLSRFSVDVGDVVLIVTAYTQLLVANGGNHRQTKLVFGKLLAEASDYSEPLVWLEKELQWEVQASAVGNRKLAAINALEGSDRATDEKLDSYNQRMSR